LGEFTLGEVQETTFDSWNMVFDIQFRFIYHENIPDMKRVMELNRQDRNAGNPTSLLAFGIKEAEYVTAIMAFAPFFNDVWIAVNDGTGAFIPIGLD